ncbi:MAG TPA: hypothetical protein PLX84_13095 [Acidiphilium sp.]|nr:hypothetical protein [Acidiphilium sp.]
MPVSALFLGWLALGESVAPRALGGIAVIGLGVACIDGRIARILLVKLRRPGGGARLEEVVMHLFNDGDGI